MGILTSDGIPGLDRTAGAYRAKYNLKTALREEGGAINGVPSCLFRFRDCAQGQLGSHAAVVLRDAVPSDVAGRRN